MYAAILIVHVLLLRGFIEGMMRRDFDLFGGELSTKIYYEVEVDAAGVQQKYANNTLKYTDVVAKCDNSILDGDGNG